jgi:hypothetical protein
MNDLKKMDTEFEFPKGSSVSGALETFAEEHTIDMMAMIPHRHNLLERFFVESTTNKMIFHTHIPLLILPQKKISRDDAPTTHFLLSTVIAWLSFHSLNPLNWPVRQL